MKLSQIYANQFFKKVVFNENVNVILAKVTKPLDRTQDSHNLGKSTLISVIDFLLLKKVSASHLFYKFKNKFIDHVFFLEILLEDGNYLTIRRSVKDNTRISFKFHSKGKSNFNKISVKWDNEGLNLTAATKLLNKILKFEILPKWSYRKSISYFLRTQQDYNDVFQLAKFKGKHEDWKPFLFDLLGFEGALLKEKYDLEEQKSEQVTLIKKVKKQFAIDPEESDKIKGAIELKKDEQLEFQEKIDNFNFYNKERELNRELIENIESNIAALNKEEYDIGLELEKINESFENNSPFNIEDVKQVYEEAEIYFSDYLSKKYEDLEEFNRKITEERNKFLKERRKKLIENLNTTRTNLRKYNEERNEHLSLLKDKDSFRKFKNYQKELAKIEGDIVRLEEKLKSINTIDKLKEGIYDIEDDLKITSENIKKEIKVGTDRYREIRKNFSSIIKYILNAPAILYITTNNSNNVDFKAEIQRNNTVTGEAEGTSYQKILCIAFDLAILITYNKSRFYKFTYHDGVLETLDNRKRQNFIKLIYRICKRFNIQYIFSAIEDHLPRDEANEKMNFKSNEIAVILDDTGDKGKLFEMSF